MPAIDVRISSRAPLRAFEARARLSVRHDSTGTERAGCWIWLKATIRAAAAAVLAKSAATCLTRRPTYTAPHVATSRVDGCFTDGDRGHQRLRRTDDDDQDGSTGGAGLHE